MSLAPATVAGGADGLRLTRGRHRTIALEDRSELVLIRDREGFDAIEPAWEQLEAEITGAIFFQSAAWCRAVFDFEAERGNRAFDPVLAILVQNGTLRAVLPLERVRTPTRRVLMPLGQAFAQYSDVLIAPELEAHSTVAGLIRAAAQGAPADSLSFLKVRADSALMRGMPEPGIVTGTIQGAPYVSLSDFADFGGYFATIKAKTRKNMRNARNRLEREGPLTHEVADTHSAIGGIIERTLSGRSDRLRDQGLTSRAFADPAFAQFCRRLVDQPGIDILATSLRHSGEPIAEQWGFVHNRRYYAFVASRDFSHSDESPGKLHLGEVIHACAERGLDGADLLVPVMPYKLTWATETIAVTDYALPLTRRGQFLIALWDQRLRPSLKRAVLAMPRQARTLVMRLAGRSA